MLRKRISYAVRAAALGCLWIALLLIGFLAWDYQDDIVLGLYIIAGASGLTAFVGWAFMGH
jgi:hypothetical protein